jgi:N-acetylmuramoyl-L-alanine amidase
MARATEGTVGGAARARLKRQLLAGAIRENVALIEGRRAERPRPRRALRLGGPLGFVAGTLLASALAVLAAPHLSLSPESSTRPLPEPPAAVSPPFAEPGGVSLAGLATGVPARVAGEVFPLAARRIVLDPGHGGGDGGTAIGALREKDITLDLARRLGDLLAAEGFEVHLTREDDRRISLRDRAAVANALPADLFLSIHVNWIADGRGSRGIETYYLGPTDDPYLTRLASAENAESGYSRADIRSLLEGIYQDLRQEESARAASSVQQALHSSLGEVNPGLENWGVKSAPFLVLVATEMPAVLAEVSSLSHPEEARLLSQPEYRERIAQALLTGVRAYADRHAPAGGGPSQQRSAQR